MSHLLGYHPGDGLHIRDEGGRVVATSGRVIGRRLVHLQQHKQTCEINCQHKYNQISLLIYKLGCFTILFMNG